MHFKPDYVRSLPRDGLAGLVVFLVALPLCLGIALASDAPPISGIVAGIIGGLVVVWISGSHTSVSGPAAGLTAIVAAQIAALGSFEAFLVAVILAGVLQLVMAAVRAGALAAFFPSSVINGLLAAIGVILILKQIPHLLGNDSDWLGDLSFQQIDGFNTVSEIFMALTAIEPGPALIGLICLVVMVGWDKTPLSRLNIPAPLIVVMVGVALHLFLQSMGGNWVIGTEHLVQVPVLDNVDDLDAAFFSPDFSALGNPAIVTAAITIAVVASLETLLNLEAVDKIDPQKRISPPNRELMAQGVGNIACGFAGGLPVTSVIVRSSVGIHSGAQTRMACFIHGLLLLAATLLLASTINQIPLASLAAILLATGFKLASPKLMRQEWEGGKTQFIPFIVTIVAIVFTDLLVGIIIGMVVAAGFILRGNLRSPIRQHIEVHASGEVTRIELPQQVSFLNRAALLEALHGLEEDSAVVLDARETVYIDPDVIELITEFERDFAPPHNLSVSRLGFQDRYELTDHVAYSEVSTRELQADATPQSVLERLKEGNERFIAGELSERDYRSQRDKAAEGQFPLAVVLSCMDSRVHANMIFDMGIGDMFSIRVAGNIATDEALGSMEYGCAIAGAKLILVLGHTKCGAVHAAVEAAGEPGAEPPPGYIGTITGPILRAIPEAQAGGGADSLADRVTVENVNLGVSRIRQDSRRLAEMIDAGEVLLCGAVYDVDTGRVEFLDNPNLGD